MCEHHHENESNHEHCPNSFPLIRVFAAVLIFGAALAADLSGAVRFGVFLAAYVLAGGDVVLKAFKNITRGEVFDENFLMSVATLGAFAIKEYPEAVMVMVLYQIGEYLQHRAVKKSRNSISALMDIRPDYANIEKDGQLVRVLPKDLHPGDIIVVKTGEKIPLDGVLIEGKAVVDTSALTGESVPGTLKIGENAYSGSINAGGLIKIRVTKPFAESTVAKILEMVENAASRKAKAENFITKFAKYYTPAVVAGALILAVLPPVLGFGAFSVWIERALTFLVISCPCALVISVPLSFFAGIGGASRAGILIKGSSFLELLAKPDAVVFDKTGTLTKGTFKVTEIVPENGFSKEEVLECAVFAENYSNHPIAASLKSAWGKEIDSTRIKSEEELAGRGIRAVVGCDEILCGNGLLMEQFSVDYSKNESAGTVVYVAKNGKYAGCIVISDEIKEDAADAIKSLKNIFAKTYMLTGDNAKTAQYWANELHMDGFFAELMPIDKVEKLERLISEKARGKSVIFAGDGINDAPVLTRADVGIAMGGLGSDAAIEAADAVIMDDKPSKVALAIKIAQKTMKIVKQNIVFAIGIKALFLILGAFGLMSMWGAVFADVGVTLIAVLNALRALKV